MEIINVLKMENINNIAEMKNKKKYKDKEIMEIIQNNKINSSLQNLKHTFQQIHPFFISSIFQYMTYFDIILFFYKHYLLSISDFITYISFDNRDNDISMLLMPIELLLSIIQTNNIEIVEFILNIPNTIKYGNLIFSFVILYGSNDMVLRCMKHQNILNMVWKFDINTVTTHYGLELLCLKMRNRIYMKNYFDILSYLQLYYCQNEKINNIFKNYYSLNYYIPSVDNKCCLYMEDIYKKMILTNKSIHFYYIEFNSTKFIQWEIRNWIGTEIGGYLEDEEEEE